MQKQQKRATIAAFLAAVLYAASMPFIKYIVNDIPTFLISACLYLGAGLAMSAVSLFQKLTRKQSNAPVELPLDRRDLLPLLCMIVLDVVAPVMLMLGLKRTTAANASLLNCFEIVATSLFALAFFKEKISGRLWIGIGFVVLASAVLSFEGADSLNFSVGSLFVLIACSCWALENNLSKKLSGKNPSHIVALNSLGSGFAALIISLCLAEGFAEPKFLLMALAVGAVSYGVSVFLYIHAQRYLGASKTSAYYAVNPFVGALISVLLFKTLPEWNFYVALALLLVGTYFTTWDSKKGKIEKLSVENTDTPKR